MWHTSILVLVEHRIENTCLILLIFPFHNEPKNHSLGFLPGPDLDFWRYSDSCNVDLMFANFIVEWMIQKLSVLLVEPEMVKFLRSWKIPIIIQCIVFIQFRWEDDKHGKKTVKCLWMIKPEAIFVKGDTFEENSFSFVDSCNFRLVSLIKAGTDLVRFPMNSFERLTNTRVVLDSNSVVCPSHGSAVELEEGLYSVWHNTNDIPQFWFFIVHWCLCADKGVHIFKLTLAQTTPNFCHIPSTFRDNYLNFCKGKFFRFRNHSDPFPSNWSGDT